MGLDVLDRINKQKSYETYMKNYGVYSKAVFETEFYGKQAMSEFLSLFPKYTGLERYDIGFKQVNWTLNTKLFCDKLDQYLREKKSNV